MASDAAPLRGTLRLLIPASFEPWWQLIAACQRHHAQVRVSVFTTERRVDLVEDGIDVALRVGEVVHEAMVGQCLCSYRHVLVASPRLLAQWGEPTSPEDLRSRAVAGELLTELPPFLAQEGLQRGELKLVLPGHPMPAWDVWLRSPSRRFVWAIVRSCIDFCPAHAKAAGAGRTTELMLQRTGLQAQKHR